MASEHYSALLDTGQLLELESLAWLDIELRLNFVKQFSTSRVDSVFIIHPILRKHHMFALIDFLFCGVKDILL